MSVKILADENIDGFLINELRKAGYTVFSIWEKSRGISDLEVIKLAINGSFLILTEDKDFGEWVFAHHENTVGVIFLRYHFQQRKDIVLSLINVLSHYKEYLYNKFTVVTQNKVRIRDL